MMTQPNPKSDIKQQAENAIKALPRCSECRKFKSTDKVSPAWQCNGHGGGGTPDGASSEAEKKGGTTPSNKPTKPDNVTSAANNELSAGIVMAPSIRLQPELSLKKTFDTDIISELLSEGSLFIKNKTEIGTLTVKLRTPLEGRYREEFDNFTAAILMELSEFAEKNGIKDDCIIVDATDKKGLITAFRVKLTPMLYKNFIDELAKNDLLPIQTINQKPDEDVTFEKGKNHFPKPSAKKKKVEEPQPAAKVKKSLTPFSTAPKIPGT